MSNKHLSSKISVLGLISILLIVPFSSLDQAVLGDGFASGN
jgi:hypothetical protein